ncbi:MAG: histidine kinase [Flavobacteriia bacterium]|nr:histidine kinase [Flavobacteriia bacterium]
MKKTIRPILLRALSAFTLAFLYLIGSGLLFTRNDAGFNVDFGAFYTDIIAFFILIYFLQRIRIKYPADRNSQGPLGVYVQRMLLLLIPALILIRLSIETKVAIGSWFTYVSFSQIAASSTVAIVVLFVYAGLDMGYELMDKWRTSEAEKEKLHRLHTQAQLENLKAQVNPHFLFNSLNTLSSLIIEDETRARQFVRQLSAVYRYILENREKDTVPLENEKKLFESYVYLCETRFEENIRVQSSWPSDLNKWRIPPMTLQILVENAIKHNIISKSKPLDLWLTFHPNGVLEVGNTDQPKKQLDKGTGFGLSNIRERFAQLSNQNIEIDQSEGNFVVTLPLIKA